MKRTTLEKVFDVINIFGMFLIVVIMLYPIWNTLVISFNDARDTIRGGITLWPRVWSMFNYQSVFKNEYLLDAFFVSVVRTVISVVINVLSAGLLAYILSRNEFVLRKFLTIFMILTMYVSAGLIPQFFLIRDLGLYNNFWVYVLPGMVGPFNVIVVRTYIKSLPGSLVEAAKIDGAGELRIFLSIIFPLCLPVLATIALWVGVGAWNSWFDSFIFAPAQQHSTLQYELMKMLSASMQFGANQAPEYMMPGQEMRNIVTPNSIRAAMTIVATVPILFVYPFLQKYFVTVNIGSVKE
ncbi:MAG: carbohydrate ABC transporter permease [Oscillospiraceae bacterium]|nr:carbohydrate ABC transporter permease [Oscillospiraceae bacterium]